MQRDEHQAYHRNQATLIAAELDRLGSEFAEDGIVKTVLRERVVQEDQLSDIIASGGVCHCLKSTPILGGE